MTETRKMYLLVVAMNAFNFLWAFDLFKFHWITLQWYVDLQEAVLGLLVRKCGDPIIAAIGFAWICFPTMPFMVALFALDEADTAEQRKLGNLRRFRKLKAIPLTPV